MFPSEVDLLVLFFSTTERERDRELDRQTERERERERGGGGGGEIVMNYSRTVSNCQRDGVYFIS